MLFTRVPNPARPFCGWVEVQASPIALSNRGMYGANVCAIDSTSFPLYLVVWPTMVSRLT